MSRTTFADLIRSAGVNYVAEYNMLLNIVSSPARDVFHDPIFHDYELGDYSERRSFFDVCNENFDKFPFKLAGTCRTISEFDTYYGYSPTKQSDCGLDGLLLFVEYIMTFATALESVLSGSPFLQNEKTLNRKIISHTLKMSSKLQHRVVADEAFIKLVPDDVVVAEVAANLPQEVSIKTFLYHHRSMAGNLEGKQHVLKLLGDQLEPRRSEIHDTELRSAIFSVLNNMQVRHNNKALGGAKYRAFVAGLSAQELETWYDRLYDMMIAAFSGLSAQQALAEYNRHKDEIGR